MAESPAPAKPDVEPSTFFSVDMRVGRVLAVEPLAQARIPAYTMTVDFGPLGVRRTSAQVTHYDPDALIGRMIVGAVNLGPKRVAGFRSEFLVLGAVGPDGTVRLLRPDSGAAPGDAVA